MDDVKRRDLEAMLKEVLKQHQREGLNMIGNVDQLLQRLAGAVEQWIDDDRVVERKTA